MPILDHWELELTTEEVLRAQGADPGVMRSRRPALIKSTEEAIERGRTLLRPLVLYERYPVRGITHERLDLIAHNTDRGRYYLSGKLIAQHLTRAEEVILILCTIGSDLDNTVSSLFNLNPMVAMALDGVGSAAVENLALQACNYFELQAKDEGLKTTMPLNPGMVGWPVEVGQPQIFSLLDCERIQVTLTDAWMMVPNKSLSMVLGIGKEVTVSGSTCEFCNLKGVCNYQNHYAKTA